jgi:Tol biopolymer transport system component/DNA-binding winged helix-turn-helix (wHTH) protein
VFELDLRAGELRRNGLKVKLQEQPFQVLSLLLERPGEVVTREDLRNRLWPADTFVDFDHSLNAAIRRLRDALGDSAENPTFVETVARRGYRFLAPVSPSPANGEGLSAPPPGATMPRQETPASSAVHVHLWWIAAATAVVLLLLGIRVGLSLARHHPEPQALARTSRLTANPADDRVGAAAISRDGRYLAFSDETGFYLRQIDSGETHPLALPEGMRAESMGWFPDSAHLIVALTSPAQISSLWEISTLGGTARKLSDDGRLPAVSPDGKQIAFVTGNTLHGQLWLMAADGSQPHQLAGEEGCFFGTLAWSPDSSRIAYTMGEISYSFGTPGVIKSVDIRDQRVSPLLQISSMQHWLASFEGPFAWVPDGRIVYTLAEPPPRQPDSNLWSIALDPAGHPVGPPLRLTSDSGAVLAVSTSGDGKRIVYVKGTPQPDVYVARLEGPAKISEPVRLTLDDRQDMPFDWTPDGKAVFFISDRSGTFNLYRQAMDQTQPELLVGGTRPVLTPRLSPDGSQLLYLVFPGWSSNGSTTVSLMRLPLEGGPPQEVLQANLINNQQCARAPATLCLYSTITRDQFTLFSFDPLKGTGAQVYQIKDDTPPLYNWSLSPDGATLAIARSKQDSRIRLVSLQTGVERWLNISGGPGIATLDWAADSKSMWAASSGEEENALLNIDLQGRARTVWRPKKMTVHWAIPSRDGRSLALHVSSTTANAWMLERP